MQNGKEELSKEETNPKEESSGQVLFLRIIKKT
jgi:hypothetical protein